VLFTGYYPYNNKDQEGKTVEIEHEIQNKDYDYKARLLNSQDVCENAKEFIDACLQKKPLCRRSASLLKEMKFFEASKSMN
jgi:hypothetical protein